MTLRQLGLMYQLLNFLGQFQQSKQIGHRRTISPYQAGDFSLGQLKLLAEALVAGRLVDCAQVVALQIFDQSQGQEGRIVDLLHNGRDFGPTESLHGTLSTLSRDKLVLSIPW